MCQCVCHAGFLSHSHTHTRTHTGVSFIHRNQRNFYTFPKKKTKFISDKKSGNQLGIIISVRNYKIHTCISPRGADTIFMWLIRVGFPHCRNCFLDQSAYRATRVQLLLIKSLVRTGLSPSTDPTNGQSESPLACTHSCIHSTHTYTHVCASICWNLAKSCTFNAIAVHSSRCSYILWGNTDWKLSAFLARCLQRNTYTNENNILVSMSLRVATKW